VGNQGDLGGPGLLRTQHGVGAHLGEEPVTEVRRGFNHPAAEKVGVGIEEVGGDGEEPSQRNRLLPEDRQRHRVTVFGVLADKLGRLAYREAT
jgi:hypothetical protein